MLPLVAIDGDAGNEGYRGAMRPTPELEQSPYLASLLAVLGVTLGRTRLMRLAGQAEVSRHVDQGYYWAERVRVHVPIMTQPSVRFECGDQAVHMAEGECWIFDTWREHRVLNQGDQARVHLVADTIGGERFWRHVGAGRRVDAAAGPWQPIRIEANQQISEALVFESFNVPAVMTPWEVERHLRFIFEEAVPTQHLAPARAIAAQFVLAWKALWAAYGERPEEREAYRRRLARFLADVETHAKSINLGNGVNCFSAIGNIVAKFAVAVN